MAPQSLAPRRTQCIFVLALLTFSHGAQGQSSPTTQQRASLHLANTQLPDARLTDIDEQGKLLFEAKRVSRMVAVGEIVRWNGRRAASGADLVWLSDGSWLAGRIQWTNDQTIAVNSDWFETLVLKLDQIKGLLLRPSPSQRVVLELQRKMAEASGSADTVWNSRSEQLAGVLTVTLRASSDGNTSLRPVWNFQPSGAAEKVELDDDSIQAIVFSPVLRRPLRTTAQALEVTLRDGSRLRVQSLQRTSDGRVNVTLTDRQSLVSIDPSEQFVQAVASLAGQPDGLQWLSDLEPARYRLLENDRQLSWPLGRNRDLHGATLFGTGESLRHSLVIHSPAQAAYRVDATADRLLGEVQLLPVGNSIVPAIGSVQCKILVARGNQLVEVFDSGVLRPESPAVSFDIDLDGVQLVVLLVDEADQGTIGDHALWRDVRIVANPYPSLRNR